MKKGCSTIAIVFVAIIVIIIIYFKGSQFVYKMQYKDGVPEELDESWQAYMSRDDGDDGIPKNGEPRVDFEKDEIFVKTDGDKEYFSLADTLDGDEITSAKLDTVGEDAFKIKVATEDDHFYFVYVTADLRDTYIMKDDFKSFRIQHATYSEIRKFEKKFIEFVKDDSFDQFASIYPAIDGEEDYLAIDDQIIYDRTKEEFIHFTDDLLSEDFSYVYLDVGPARRSTAKIEEGEQRFQPIADYLAENKDNITSFTLNYKAIEKASKVNKIFTVGTAYERVEFFSDSLIVYDLLYNAPITGKAGYVIVAIDFSENKEKKYILEIREI